MTFQLNILTNGMSITLVLVPHQLLTKSDEKKKVFFGEAKRDIFRSRKVHKKMDLPHQSPCLI